MLLLLLSPSQGAWAWGPEGHQAVGLIAADFLTPLARDRVDHLLAGEHLGDVRVTSWADYLRGNKRMRMVYPDNDRWHYLDGDVNAGADALQPSTDGNDDDYLLFEAKAGQDVTNFALRLAAAITPEQAAAWSQGQPLDWARESHLLAVSNVYRFADGTALPSTNALVPLNLNETNYVSGNSAVVSVQLQKAGVRLAHLLNTALDR